jgi:hypothetical protein
LKDWLRARTICRGIAVVERKHTIRWNTAHPEDDRASARIVRGRARNEADIQSEVPESAA